MTDEHDDDDADVDPDDDGILDTMRDSGVGVRDPNITDPEEPGLVDDDHDLDVRHEEI